MYINLLLGILGTLTTIVTAKIHPLVRCSPLSLDVRVPSQNIKAVKLLKWSVIPGCQSVMDGKDFYLSLKLSNELSCGTTRIKNKITGETVYYHRMVIIEDNGTEHLFKLTCLVSADRDVKSNIVKRNVLPAEFVEPDYIEITSEISGVAPIPELSVGVRQGGNLIGNSVTVQPGAPLEMEVYLDSVSASIYGILVNYMVVTDLTDKNETIIYNGCTQDQYVFENFKTDDGDYLKAKFRAFKFPGSTYLLFRGTVDVCLDKCQGIACSNGEIGFGRRRRSIADSNKVFEVNMVTFIKIEEYKSQPSSKKEAYLKSRNSAPSSTFYEEKMEVNEINETPYFLFGAHGSSNQLGLSGFLLILTFIQQVLKVIDLVRY